MSSASFFLGRGTEMPTHPGQGNGRTKQRFPSKSGSAAGEFIGLNYSSMVVV